MKYAVVQVVNGSCSVVSEGWTDISKAKVSFHNTCKVLYNDVANVQTMGVLILDNLGNPIKEERYDKSMDEVAEESVEG